MSDSFQNDLVLKNEEHGDNVSSSLEETAKSKHAQLQNMAKAKALSMAFMKSFSGLCCENCNNDPFKSVHEDYSKKKNDTRSTEVESDSFMSPGNGPFHLDSSTISPLVVGPMLSKNLDYQQPGTIETLIGEYMCFCRFYKVHYNAGILTALRFSSQCLRPSGAFHDADMLALVETLFRHANGALKHIIRLDFSIAGKQGKHERNKKLVGFTSHGALALAKALQTTKYVRQVFLQRNQIGSYGASAIFIACQMNPSIEELNLRRCQIGKRGALAFCEIILLEMDQQSLFSEESDVKRGTGAEKSGLVNVNLSVNHIGYHGTVAIENLLKKRNSDDELVINMDGNLVFPEIMNAATHCMGVLLSLVGGHLLSQKVRDTTFTHRVSCAIYTGSLISLYLSSTLFHSFFAMVNTRHVFRVMDKCAIYILIAGSYTPYMQILLSGQSLYSFGLLGFIWLCCILGVLVEALYPNWEHKTKFSLCMYLGMGWCCVVCLPQMMLRLHTPCVYLILLGGVAYTAGVPFFVRNNNLDHAIWHLFVMSGSIVHWIAVYFHVASTPLNDFIENQ